MEHITLSWFLLDNEPCTIVSFLPELLIQWPNDRMFYDDYCCTVLHRLINSLVEIALCALAIQQAAEHVCQKYCLPVDKHCDQSCSPVKSLVNCLPSWNHNAESTLMCNGFFTCIINVNVVRYSRSSTRARNWSWSLGSQRCRWLGHEPGSRLPLLSARPTFYIFSHRHHCPQPVPSYTACDLTYKSQVRCPTSGATTQPMHN